MPTLESLLAFDAGQLGGVSRTSVEAPTGDLAEVLGRVVDADYLEPGLCQNSLVLPSLARCNIGPPDPHATSRKRTAG